MSDQAVTPQDPNYCLVEGDIRIILEWIGEGWNGDYDAEDPEDEALLRFSVYVRGALRQRFLDEAEHLLEDTSPITDPERWVGVENASYCTRLPANLPTDMLNKAGRLLLGAFRDPLVKAQSIKRAAQELSWLSPTDLKGMK